MISVGMTSCAQFFDAEADRQRTHRHTGIRWWPSIGGHRAPGIPRQEGKTLEHRTAQRTGLFGTQRPQLGYHV